MTESQLHCRVADDGLSYIDGIIVPWNQTITYRGQEERFAPGGLTANPEAPVPLRYQHLGEIDSLPVPIGVLHRSVDTAEGLWGEFKIFENAHARAAYEAADARLITGFSPEFSNRSPGRPAHAKGQGTVVRGLLTGAAMVHKPAYSGARIQNVRARTPAADRYAVLISKYPSNKWRPSNG